MYDCVFTTLDFPVILDGQFISYNYKWFGNLKCERAQY
jgi:hypothetical protein